MAAASTAARRAPARPGIRWDRLSRYALLLVFVVLVLLYIGPARSYFATRAKAHRMDAQVASLEREHARLEARKRQFADPNFVESEARRLGMVRPGERAFVVRNLPPGR
jgi:cell division protein FtsB